MALLCTGILYSCSDLKNHYEVTDTVNRFFKALNKHDTILIAKFFADTAKLESPNWEGYKVGPSGAKEVYGKYFTSSPDVKYDIKEVTIGPGAAVVEYVVTGTLKNAETGTPAYMIGKKYSLKNITRFNLHEGKILAESSYFDQVAYLKQMGFFEQHYPLHE